MKPYGNMGRGFEQEKYCLKLNLYVLKGIVRNIAKVLKTLNSMLLQSQCSEKVKQCLCCQTGSS